MHACRLHTYTYMYMCMSLQSCWTLCNLMDCGLPGSSVHGIPQARILEWVVDSSSKGSSQPRDQSHIFYVSCIGGQILYHTGSQSAKSQSHLSTGDCHCLSSALFGALNPGPNQRGEMESEERWELPVWSYEKCTSIFFWPSHTEGKWQSRSLWRNINTIHLLEL